MRASYESRTIIAIIRKYAAKISRKKITKPINAKLENPPGESVAPENPAAMTIPKTTSTIIGKRLRSKNQKKWRKKIEKESPAICPIPNVDRGVPDVSVIEAP